MRANPRSFDTFRHKARKKAAPAAPETTPLPLLPASDLRRTCVFYSALPGVAVYKDLDGLRVRGCGLDLKLLRTGTEAQRPALDIVVRVKNLEKLHRACQHRGLPAPGRLQHCGNDGLRFSLSDPDGNKLHFVQAGPASIPI